MAKSTKKKILSFLNLLILFVLFCCISGCGNSETTAGDTTTGAGQQIALTGSPTSLAAGQTSILTAMVTDSKGIPVANATVAFNFVTNNSTGTVAALNGGKTDAGGHALALYTAGATNPTADVQDTIQASIAGAMGVVTITRISTSTPSTGHEIFLSASLTSLAAGEPSIITAIVRDGSGNRVSGQAVTFTILSNNSGAPPLTILGLGITDVGGQASATYTAGANSPTTNVQDMIQASITDATGAIIITRTASSPPTGLSLALAADATSLAAGQTTIIKATVTDASANPVSGQAVTFLILSNNSGAPPLTILGLGVTDADGQASATYIAGANSPTTSVQDTIQASVTGTTKAVIITRTAGTGPTGTAASLDLLAQPTTVKSDDSTTSTITVRALNTLNAALSGVTITMGTDTGVLSAATAVTGSDGKATLTFSSGSNPFNRTATITATAGTATKQIPVQIVGSTVTLTSNKTTLPDDGSLPATFIVTARDAGGNIVPNAAVNLTKTGAGNVTIAPASGTTNGSGTFTATVAGTAVGAITITATALGATATQSLTVSASGAVFGIDKQWLNAVDIGNPKPTAMKIVDSLAIEVNAPSPTTNVTFATTTGKWNGLTKVETVAVVAGKATATLTTTQAGIASIQVYDSASPTTSDTLTVAMTSATAYKISLQATPTIVPKSVGTTTGSSTLIATVRDSSNYPVGGASVSFDIVNPTGGGETISPVVALTAATTTGGLNLGEARASFSSGSLSSSMSGIQIRASVIGTTVATGTSPSGSDATVVIGGTAGSVAIGRATKVSTSENNASYILAMSVLVADSNGNPAPAGTQVSLSAWPIAWTTGTNCTPDPDYYSVYNPVTFVYDVFRYDNRGTFRGEDANENLVIDVGEDGTRIFYADGVTAVGTGTVDGYLTPTNSAGGTVPATVTTDANGVANFNLTYLKANALWTLTRIRASAIVQGSETVGQVIFRLPVLVPDDAEFLADGTVVKCYLPSSPYIF